MKTRNCNTKRKGHTPMEKQSISLIIDDPAPRVHVYREHAKSPCTRDGRPLLDNIPNDFLSDFCDVCEQYGLAGKFSIVPNPGCRGEISHGVEGFPYSEILEWLDIAKRRLGERFTFGPEMLTHHKAVDLKTGAYYDCNEMEWAATQTRESLAEYIAHALQILRDVGIRAVGVTSPWAFGIELEDIYTAAISDAVYRVWGETRAWYFLRGMRGVPKASPWRAYWTAERSVISIPATLNDEFWETIENPDTSEAHVKERADRILTEDGKHGSFADALRIGAMPVLISHWQSLYSNGKRTGLRALAETARRIEKNYGREVEWQSFEEIMRRY